MASFSFYSMWATNGPKKLNLCRQQGMVCFLGLNRSVLNRKPMVQWKREESPSARISNTNAERNPSINNQIINITVDTGSNAMSKHILKTKSLLIREIRVMMLSCRSDRFNGIHNCWAEHHETFQASSSNAQDFHQASPESYSHLYKHINMDKQQKKHTRVK